MSPQEIKPGLPPPPPRPKPPAPLLPLAVGLIIGIVADDLLALPGWVAVVVVGGAVIPALRSRHATVGLAAIVVAAAGVGSLRHAVADRWFPENHIVFFAEKEPMLVKLRGGVVGSPYIVEPAPEVPRAYSVPPKTHFIIEARQLAGKDGPIPTCGRVAVSIKGPVLSLEAGDVVEMTGWMFRPRGPRNPGEYDWALHQRRAGLLVRMTCDHAESVVVLERAAGGGWSRLLVRIRGRLHGYLLNSAFEEDDAGAGVISAMVLAARSAVPQAMNQAFIRTGNAHYLAASGMNVAWLAVTCWGLMRFLGVYYRTTAVVVGLLILSYVLLAEPQPSILRAGIMGLLCCVSIYLRGQTNVLNWLACSAIVILMIDPMDCFRPAFQYSFMAVMAIVHLHPKVNAAIATGLGKTRWAGLARFFDEKAYHLSLIDLSTSSGSVAATLGRRTLYWLVQMLVLSFSAWLVTAPLCCYQFNQFTPWGAVGTFILWFFAAPVTCWGYITLLLGLVFPSSGAICGPVLKAGTDVMVHVVQLLARIPGTIMDGRSPSIWWVLAVYAVLVVWLYKPAWLSWKHRFKGAALLLVIWWLIPPRWVHAESKVLQAWVLTVGDGAGVVLELPHGRVVVCDFGTRSGFDVGPVGVSFLKHRGIRKLDAVYVSHANFDHFSGIEALSRDFDIGKVVINGHFERFAPEQSAAGRFLQAIRRAGIPIEVINGPRVLDRDEDATIEMLWPPPPQDMLSVDANNASTVLRVTCQGRAIILPGDVEDLATGRLLAEADLKADALLLPHHGSVSGNTARFIGQTDPRVVIRSSGQRQSATTSGIEALAKGRALFNTADVGCVLVEVREGELSAEAVMRD